ncbi:MAG: MarR family transcriptional regulator [Gemmiger sp.]|nr:MarR family transcriptional regulator [Gemmiger sp.]
MQQTLAYFVTLLRKNFTEYCNRRLAKVGLTQGQLYFILYIGRHPRCAPKQAAQALQVDAGQATRTLARLVQDGFVLQEKDEKDRRAHTLRLTEQGQAAFGLSHALLTQWEAKALCVLSAKEQATLLALLAKVARQGWQNEENEPGEKNQPAQ